MSNKLILRILKRSLEYFIIGMTIDLFENMLVIKFATNEVITWQTVKIAFLVVLPFAILMEVVFDPIIRRKFFSSEESKKKK
jgi:hypothetical protein